jgi:hypothetical protein
MGVRAGVTEYCAALDPLLVKRQLDASIALMINVG